MDASGGDRDFAIWRTRGHLNFDNIYPEAGREGGHACAQVSPNTNYQNN